MILAAQKVFIGNYSNYLNPSIWMGERRNSSSRMAHEAEIDICGIFDTLHVLNNYTFVAENLNNLPKCSPEELNVAAVIDKT